MRRLVLARWTWRALRRRGTRRRRAATITLAVVRAHDRAACPDCQAATWRHWRPVRGWLEAR